MYLPYFKLKTSPFRITPDPAFLFWTDNHGAIADALERSVRDIVPVTLITGDVGAGKSTLLFRFLEGVPEDVTVGLVNTYQSGMENLGHWLLLAFDLPTDSDAQAQEARFVDFVESEAARGRRCVLIFDEAQNISDGDLAELNRLSEMLCRDAAALLLILVGQTELRTQLNRRPKPQIARRIGASAELGAMSAEETKGYIRHRLGVAGASPDIYAPEVLDRIAELSGGVPRKINIICEMLLFAAYHAGTHEIDAPFLRDFLEDTSRTGMLSHIVRKPLHQKVLRGLGKAQPTAKKKAKPAQKRKAGKTTAKLPETPAETQAPGSGGTEAEKGAPEDVLVLATRLAQLPVKQRASEDGLPATPTGELALRKARERSTALMVVNRRRPNVLRLFGLAVLGGAGAATLAFTFFPPSGFLSARLDEIDRIVHVASGRPMAEIAENEPPPPAEAAAEPVDVPGTAGTETGDEVAALNLPAEPWLPAALAVPEVAPVPDAPSAVLLEQAITVGTSDPRAAAIGYARAALRGQGRAAYYLGQMFETGDGVPRDPALARRWYAHGAESNRSAARRLAAMPAEAPAAASELAPPLPLFGAQTFDGGAEFFWAGGSGSAGVTYMVETAAGPDSPLGRHGPVEISALRLDAHEEARLWRVLAISTATGQYRASGWWMLSATPQMVVFPGSHRVRPSVELKLTDRDRTAEAERIAGLLEREGISSRIVIDAAGAGQPGRIAFHYRQDRATAAQIAALVSEGAAEPPALATPQNTGATRPLPGTITITLGE